MKIQHNMDSANRRRVFIIECDAGIAERLLAALVTPRNNEEGFQYTNKHIECSVIRSQKEFFESDPAMWDLVVCASHLQDGSGFDVLSYVQGLRPDVPVILTGHPEESDAAVEAIRAGAADYLMLTGHEMTTFPVTVQKCLALQVIRTENDDLHADLSQSLSDWQ